MLKITRLLFTFLTTALLIGSLSLSAFASTDIGGHKNERAIKYLIDNKVVSGYQDGTFKPNNVINRAELLKILVLGQGIEPDKDNYKNCFKDVFNEWFAPYVCYAKEKEWVAGYADGSFKPAKPLNKVEAVKMLINSQDFGEDKETELNFSDAGGEGWYLPFLRTAKRLGLLEQETGRYGVDQEMTRAEIAENLYRSVIVKKEKLKSFADFKQRVSQAVKIDGEVGKVTKVIDGDTIEVEVDGVVMKIRLIGVDTPEINGSNSVGECFGVEASEKAKIDLMGKEVVLVSDESQGNKDKYDRYLRYVYIVGESVSFNEKLIQDGYAFEYTYSTPYDQQKTFKDAEKVSMESKAGLWALDACSAEDNAEETSNADYDFYVSSKAKTKYYCETDPAWQDLSKSNLLKYEDEASLKKDFPKLTLNQRC